MATADLSGLFGGVLTPEEQQRQLTETRAAQFAQLAPSQQLAFMGYKAGAGLGQGLAQAAGVDIQDPIIKRNMSLYELAKGIDVTTVEGLQQYAARLQQAGFNAEAAQLGQKILAARKTESEITRNERERKGLDPFEQLLRTGKYTPASLAKYKKSGDATDLELIEKETKANIKEIGVAEGTREPVYLDVNNDKQFIYTTDAQGNQVRKLYTGGVDRTTAKVSATATQKAEEAGLTEMAKIDSRRVGDANLASDKAQEQKGTLQQLLATPQSISGAGAQMRVGALRVFSTLGLASPKDNEALSNADKFTSLARTNVLSFIKMLGVNPSNADREFADTIGPALEKGEKTNQDLVNYLMKKADWVQEQASQMEEHFYKNKGSLKGYKSPFVKGFNTPVNPELGAMTDDQLKAMIAAKRKGQ